MKNKTLMNTIIQCIFAVIAVLIVIGISIFTVNAINFILITSEYSKNGEIDYLDYIKANSKITVIKRSENVVNPTIKKVTVETVKTEPTIVNADDFVKNAVITYGDYLNIAYSQESLNAGYVYIQAGTKVMENLDSLYFVRITGDTSEDEEYKHQMTRRYEFTIRNFMKWTMLPLPFENNKIEIYEAITITETPYYSYYYLMKENFTLNNMGDWLRNDDPFNTKLEDAGCYQNKTTWIYWNDTSEMIDMAKEIRANTNSEFEFVLSVISTIQENIEYDYELKAALNDRTTDRNEFYDLVINDEEFAGRKGVCSDKAGAACVMIRSQGIDCNYIGGRYLEPDDFVGQEYKYHALIKIWVDGRTYYADPTQGVLYTPDINELHFGWQQLSDK